MIYLSIISAVNNGATQPGFYKYLVFTVLLYSVQALDNWDFVLKLSGVTIRRWHLFTTWYHLTKSGRFTATRSFVLTC